MSAVGLAITTRSLAVMHRRFESSMVSSLCQPSNVILNAWTFEIKFLIDPITKTTVNTTVFEYLLHKY